MRPGLYRQLPADIEAPAAARRLLRDWLAAWGWPRDEVIDVVLAVNAAVSNAVQHAGATRITIEAAIDPAADLDGQPRRACIEISDNGRWRPRPIRPADRYRGLALIHGCMDRAEVEPTGRGTRVRLVSRPVRRLPTGRTHQRGQRTGGRSRARWPRPS